MDEFTKVLFETAKPLVGVVTGWALGYWQTRRRERKVEGNVRTLLRIEIDENTAALRDYQESVRKRIGSHALQAQHFQLMVRSDSFRLTELPEWRHQAFDKLFSSLSGALNEEQIREVSDFHRRLDKLTGTFTKIRTLQRAHAQGKPMDALTGSADEWQLFEGEIADLIALGDQLQRRLQPIRLRLTAPIRKLLRRPSGSN